MLWWGWFIVGFMLLVAETLVPSGFFLFMFGLSGLTIGFLTLAEVSGPPWLQWCAAAILAVAYSLLIRRPLVERLQKAPSQSTGGLPGDTVQITETITPGQVGQGSMRGTQWRVRNNTGAELSPGDHATVDNVDGVTLNVSKKG